MTARIFIVEDNPEVARLLNTVLRDFGFDTDVCRNAAELRQRLQDHGVAINRPPRDGRMAFVRSPDNISIELLQAGAALAPAEPWKSMPNVGAW